MQYRPEIDGLRSLAVVPVVLFHAGFSMFSGGFVGVDVFFVISGYLITSILAAEIERGKFSIIRFYERRARRILPALFFVLVICVIAAWVLLPPLEMKRFAQSLFSVPLFASNVFFWNTSGYFEADTELMPLLHTWSLAVEEQFYLVFPLLLVALWRFKRQNISWILIGLAILSLCIAEYLLKHNPASAFYLIQARGWELLIGAWVALNREQVQSRLSANVASILTAFGTALILGAVFAFDKHTPFPGLFALGPTLGAALIILFGTPENGVGRLLSNKFLVSIGLISYSAYLWHQPLFAFTRIWSISHPSQIVMGTVVLVSFALAYLTWKFVEAPFRNPGRFRQRPIFVMSAIGSLCFMVIGIVGHIQGGYAYRFSDDQVRFLDHFENSRKEWKYFTSMGIPQKFRAECDFYDIQSYRNERPTKKARPSIDESCHMRSPTAKYVVLIWGDSHAQQLAPGLKKALPGEWQILQIASSGCAPQIRTSPNPDDYCHQSNWFALQSILQARPDVVLIGQNTGHQLADMKKVMEALTPIGAGRIIFVGPSPHWSMDLPKIVQQRLWGAVPKKTRVGLDQSVIDLDSRLKTSFPTTERHRYVSVIDELCNQEGCDVYFGDDVKTGISSWDYGHLTPIASEEFARRRLAREIIGKPR